MPPDGTAIADVSDVPERGSYLFTVRETDGREEEVILVSLDDGIAAWKNFCQHEPDQRLDRGVGNGAAIRDGGIVCPKHGSTFDVDSGYCDNGKAAGMTLVEVDVTVADGTVYLTDPTCEYRHEGGLDADAEDGGDDGMPSSTSHLGF